MHFCLFAAEASSSSEIPPARQTLTSTAGTTKGITLDHASQVLRGFSQENFYESPLFVKLRNWVLGKNRALPILLSKRWTGSPSPSGLFRGDRDSPICNDHFDTNMRVEAFSVQRPVVSKNNRATLRPDYLHIEPIRLGQNTWPARVLCKQGGNHQLGAKSGRRMGQIRHYRQFRGADICGNRPHAQTSSGSNFPYLRSRQDSER